MARKSLSTAEYVFPPAEPQEYLSAQDVTCFHLQGEFVEAMTRIRKNHREYGRRLSFVLRDLHDNCLPLFAEVHRILDPAPAWPRRRFPFLAEHVDAEVSALDWLLEVHLLAPLVPLRKTFYAWAQNHNLVAWNQGRPVKWVTEDAHKGYPVAWVAEDALHMLTEWHAGRVERDANNVPVWLHREAHVDWKSVVTDEEEEFLFRLGHPWPRRLYWEDDLEPGSPSGDLMDRLPRRVVHAVDVPCSGDGWHFDAENEKVFKERAMAGFKRVLTGYCKRMKALAKARGGVKAIVKRELPFHMEVFVLRNVLRLSDADLATYDIRVNPNRRFAEQKDLAILLGFQPRGPGRPRKK